MENESQSEPARMALKDSFAAAPLISPTKLWAKTAADGRWHALPYHLLDVAAAAGALWDRLPSSSRSVSMLAFQTDGCETRRLLMFLAGSHDVGKANRFFQAKDPQQAERLGRMGIDLACRSVPEPKRHGQATGSFLKPWLMEEWAWGKFPADCVARSIGGHHGTFFNDTATTCLHVHESPWSQIGRSMLDQLAQVLECKAPSEPKPLNPLLGWLAGFVSIADWIGSHKQMTVWEIHERSLSEYLDEASERAKTLLDDLHWQLPKSTDALSISDLIPEGRTPNGLQNLAAEIASDFSFAIVEAPTGEGKTEAAFILSEAPRSKGEGLYFALPTMATANGLYGRVEAYLQKASREPDVRVRLLHSQAWLFRDETAIVENPGQEGIEQSLQSQDWFAGSKRRLLTPYGVGTIDQALVAALRAKHGFVRLFALAGKTVVVDEVHAYDIYMADLLDVLLGWLRALGCKVILLSATLPCARRLALLRAWGCEDESTDGEYPCITWVNMRGGVSAKSFPVRQRKPLTIELIASDDRAPSEQGASRILELVHQKGGVGALVLNTVRDAQKAYDWLKAQEMNGIELMLFHARFTARDRDEIERRVLARFGKDGPRGRPAILVATQVVEQSLDLDFDHMVSALAPIDLLIQRAGRLHRHRRYTNGQLRSDDGSDERSNPVLKILAPTKTNADIPELREPMYAADVLMRTDQLLGNPVLISTPSDVGQAVEAVYGELTTQKAQRAWVQAYASASGREESHRRHLQDLARDACIPIANGRVPLTFRPAFMDDDEHGNADIAARTRIEDMPSITLVLLSPGDDEPTCHLTKDDKMRLVLQSVRIPAIGRRLEELLSIPIPESWKRIGPLRFAHPIRLDVNGFFATDSFVYSYSPSAGLRWRKKDA